MEPIRKLVKTKKNYFAYAMPKNVKTGFKNGKHEAKYITKSTPATKLWAPALVLPYPVWSNSTLNTKGMTSIEIR